MIKYRASYCEKHTGTNFPVPHFHLSGIRVVNKVWSNYLELSAAALLLYLKKSENFWFFDVASMFPGGIERCQLNEMVLLRKQSYFRESFRSEKLQKI